MKKEYFFNLNHENPFYLKYIKLWQPLINWLAKNKVSPDLLTWLGGLVTLAAAWLIYRGNFLTGGIIFILSTHFDLLDGIVARQTNKASAFGAYLDSVLDRYMEFVIFIAIYFHYYPFLKPWQSLAFFLALVGSILVSYTRARAEGLDIKCKVGFLQRPTRLIILSAGLIFAHFWGINLILSAVIIIAVLSHFTVIQRTIYTKKQAKGL